jgi:aspartyl/asparaginyl-tRNA synthetase
MDEFSLYTFQMFFVMIGHESKRVIAWLCGIEHIREAIPFPRTIKRVYP